MLGLSVDRICKSYGSQLAIADVSFAVAPGDIVGFVGPNGAGKSTTLRILTGLLPPTPAPSPSTDSTRPGSPRRSAHASAP